MAFISLIGYKGYVYMYALCFYGEIAMGMFRLKNKSGVIIPKVINQFRKSKVKNAKSKKISIQNLQGIITFFIHEEPRNEICLLSKVAFFYWVKKVVVDWDWYRSTNNYHILRPTKVD